MMSCNFYFSQHLVHASLIFGMTNESYVGINVLNWEANSKLQHSNAIMLFLLLEMYVAHIIVYINILLASIHVRMICMPLIQPKYKNFGCYKSFCYWMVQDPKNIIRHSMNWIFGIRNIWNIMKDALIFAPCPSKTFTTIVISTPLETTLACSSCSSPSSPLNPRVFPISQLIMKWISSVFSMRSSCTSLDSKWHFKTLKWNATKCSMYSYVEAETISFPFWVWFTILSLSWNELI